MRVSPLLQVTATLLPAMFPLLSVPDKLYADADGAVTVILNVVADAPPRVSVVRPLLVLNCNCCPTLFKK